MKNVTKKKMTLRDAVWDTLTEMTALDLLIFLAENDYYEWEEDEITMGENELADWIAENYEIIDEEED